MTTSIPASTMYWHIKALVMSISVPRLWLPKGIRESQCFHQRELHSKHNRILQSKYFGYFCITICYLHVTTCVFIQKNNHQQQLNLLTIHMTSLPQILTNYTSYNLDDCCHEPLINWNWTKQNMVCTQNNL